MSIKVQNYHLSTIAILLAGVLCFKIVLKRMNARIDIMHVVIFTANVKRNPK